MKIAILILCVLFVGFGYYNNNNALTNGVRPPESWLEEKVPTTVGEFELKANPVGSTISYKMNEPTYKELDPIGIAAQRFLAKGSKSYDAVVIAGNNMESFHDQRWCFKAQGWDIIGEEETKVMTKSYGEIPITLVTITRSDSVPTVAVFTLRGPTKFHASIPSASKDFFDYELFKQKKFIGFFFRFIPEYPGATKDDVKKFTADYIDAAHESSAGNI